MNSWYPTRKHFKPPVQPGKKQTPLKATQKKVQINYHKLMPPLRMFELVIIAKFVPASTKLCTLALLNHEWNKFLKQNVAWHSLPQVSPWWPSKTYLSFMRSLSELTGLYLTNLPLIILQNKELAPMEKCKAFSVSFDSMSQVTHFIKNHSKYLHKVTKLQLLQIQTFSKELLILKKQQVSNRLKK